MKKFITSVFKMKRAILIIPTLLFGLFTPVVNGQQVIGSFPNMNGGFEGTTGSITSTASSSSSWWLQLATSNTISITSGVGARSGNNYLNAVQTGTAARRIHSPYATNTQTAGQYTVQFYYKGDKDGTATGNIMSGALYGLTSGTYFQTWMAPLNVSWTKNAYTYTTTTDDKYYGVIRLNNGCTFDFDDFVVYAGTEDNTVPDAATDLAFTPASTQIALAWTAPATGIDGGGYLVVRYNADPTGQPDPNVNGIYAVGNTIGTGTVAYLGNNPGFSDTGLSTTTSYYYRVYTVDKAFNYAAALSGSSSTVAAGFATEPTAQVSGLNFTGVGENSMTINFSPAVSGGGTNHLVVVKATSDLTADPADGSTYNAGTTYSSGAGVGGGYVVYNGTESSVTVTGLTAFTTYYVRVYDFNGNAGTENYLTTGPAGSSQKTSRKTITSAASGAWATGATWVGGIKPTLDDNVIIANGHIITFTGISTNSCYNLTIDAGAQLYNITGTPAYSIGYMGIYGNSMIVNGTFGDAVTEYVTGIQFNQNCTLSGTGTIRINRIRPYTTAANATFTFDADATLTNSTGVTMMGENTGSNTIGYTINSGKTITSTGSITAGTGSSTNGSYPVTFTVNGTLNVNNAIYLNTAAGQACNLIVNGTLNVKTLYTSNKSTGGGQIPVITVNNPGQINITGSGAVADFSDVNTCANITGTGAFSLAAGTTIKVAAADGINATTGSVRCTSRTYDASAYFQFVGTTAQVTGAEMPSNAGRVTINNAAGVSLSSPLAISDTLVLTAGKLTLNANDLTFGVTGGTKNGSATSYIITNSTGKVSQHAQASAAVVFPVGTSDTSYDPATLTPTDATIFTVNVGTSLPGVAPSGVSYNAKMWDITSSVPSSTLLQLTPSTSVISSVSDVIGHWDGSGYVNKGAVKTADTYAATFSSFSPFVTGTADFSTTAISNLSENISISINKSEVSVHGAAEGSNITISNLNGQTIASQLSNGSINSFKLNKGIYLMSVNSNGSTVVKKLMVNEE